MKEKNITTKLLHAGENTLAKKINTGVSVPKVIPIYMSSVFSFDDVPSLDAVYAGEANGYIYGRNGHPNQEAAAESVCKDGAGTAGDPGPSGRDGAAHCPGAYESRREGTVEKDQ